MAPSLGEEGTKTIDNLKRQMFLMEEENITLFNKIYIYIYFKEDFQKAFQNMKDLEFVFQITIVDLKQIILEKDEAIQKTKRKPKLNKRIQTY